jgi:hypothetical protein
MLYVAGQTGKVEAQPHPITSNALLVSDRTALRICLEMGASLLPSAPSIAEQLSIGLGIVRQHKDWEAAGLGVKVPKPEIGCGAKIPSKSITRFELIGPGLTETPGPFRTVIVVLDDSQADTVLDRQNVQFATFELMRVDDDVAAEVTSALVVRKDFLKEPDFVDIYLPLAIGLAPTRSFPEPAGEGLTK